MCLKGGGGDDEFSLRLVVLLLNGLYSVSVLSGDCELSFRFTILLLSVFLYISIYLHIFWFVTVISKPFMGGVIINEPGFTAPAGSAPPS